MNNIIFRDEEGHEPQKGKALGRRLLGWKSGKRRGFIALAMIPLCVGLSLTSSNWSPGDWELVRTKSGGFQ